MSVDPKQSVPTQAARKAHRVGHASRLGTGLQLVLTVVLAVSAVLLVNYLAGRRGIRQRFDLTATNKNTLATATLGTLARLEDEVTIEVLYRPEVSTRQQLEGQAIVRTKDLLDLFAASSGDLVKVVMVDTTDAEAWNARSQEVRVRGFQNGVIVSRGKRVAFLALDGDLAQFQGGYEVNGAYVPPVMSAFTAEESIVEAILDVTRSDELLALFTRGAGESDITDETTEFGIGVIAETLRSEGFRVESWSQVEDGPLPDECDVLVVSGPKSPWPEVMYGEIVDYVEKGGRLVIAGAFGPEDLRASDIPDLANHLGLKISEGRVAKDAIDPLTGRPTQGIAACEIHDIPPKSPYLSTHPIVQPFRETGQVLRFFFSHEIEIAVQPTGGVAQRLVTTLPGGWLDAAPVNRVFDRGLDTRKSTQTAGFTIAATVQQPPLQDVGSPAGLEEIPEIRIVAFGSDAVFWNQTAAFSGIVLPAFNWVCDREHRISVPARDPDLRFIPRDDPRAFARVTKFAQLYLPGGVLILGILVWWLRGRGARRERVPQPATTGQAQGTTGAAGPRGKNR